MKKKKVIKDLFAKENENPVKNWSLFKKLAICEPKRITLDKQF